MNWKPIVLAGLAVSAGACGPHIRPLAEVMDNGEIVATRSDEVVEEARLAGELELEQLREQRAAAATTALASCAAEVCDAVSRGEVALGMNEAQVLAATRTTPHAWTTRGGGAVMLMTPRGQARGPSDAVAEIAWVNLQNGRVESFTYREPQGFRTVASAQDATFAGRAAAQAEALLRQGDDYALQGELDRALDYYDRADILRPGHAETTLRIASSLDKQLRPIEAILRYQMFIHQMELEKIEARGDAAAKMADAIARARERIIVLERR